jgi:hypothetical protein
MNVDQPFLIFSTLLSSLIYWFEIGSLLCDALKVELKAIGYYYLGNLDTSYAMGLLWGVQLGQNGSLHHKLQVIGMSTLWSASGLAVSLFLSAQRSIYSFLRYVYISKRTILHLLSLFFFWHMSAKSPSLLRALLMASLALIIKDLCNRQLKSIYSLFLTLCFLLIYDLLISNSQFGQSLSLQFSVAAVFGVVYLQPTIKSLFIKILLKRNRSSTFISSSSITTFISFVRKNCSWFFSMIVNNLSLLLSIQLSMLPLISQTWGEVNLVQFITSTLIAGLSPALFLLGLIWFVWTLAVFSFGLIGRFDYLSRTVSLLLIFPVKMMFQLADQLVQIEQVVLLLPPFNNLSTIAWYSAIFFVGEYYVWRMGRALRARPSFNHLTKILTP